MVKFVLFSSRNHADPVPVNPDRVAYVRKNREGATCLVFAMIPGGYDELVIDGSAQEAVAMLEGTSSSDTYQTAMDATLGAIRISSVKTRPGRAPRTKPGKMSV